MRILIMSNSPLGPTAYSTVTRYLTTLFTSLGHDVRIFAYWGIDSGHPVSFATNNKVINVIPRWYDPWGKDIFLEHYKRFKADFLLPIFDIWVTPSLGEKCKVVGYVPTDHDPPAMFLMKALEKCWKLIPFTKWAENSMKKAGLKQVMKYIPHGVDLNIFHPMDKAKIREKWVKKEDKDAFIVGIVAGNYDKEGRKRWDKHFEAIKYFKEQNPDCKLKVFIHTDVNNYRYGFDLKAMLKFFELEKITYMPDPYYFITQLPYSKMGEIYNIFDINLLISSREGFGMPYVEGQACGIPTIGTKFASAQDLVHPDLQVKVAAKIMTPIISWTAIPDAWDAAQKIEILYKSPDKYEKYKKWSLNFAKQFDWNGELVKGRWISHLDLIQDELRKVKK